MMLNQQTGNLRTAMFKVFRGCAISQNDSFGATRHSQDGFVILRPDGVGDI